MHYLCVIEIFRSSRPRILHESYTHRAVYNIVSASSATAIHRMPSRGDRNSSRFVEWRLQRFIEWRPQFIEFRRAATAIHRMSSSGDCSVSSSGDRNSSHFIELRPQSSRFIELPAQLRPQFIAFQRVRRPQSSHFIELRPQFIASFVLQWPLACESRASGQPNNPYRLIPVIDLNTQPETCVMRERADERRSRPINRKEFI